MQGTGAVRGAVVAATAGCLLLAACSSGSGDDAADQTRRLKGSLCETGISTSALRQMYPGPYSSTRMLPSTEGGIDGVENTREKTEGGCEVWITQEEGDVGTSLKVLVSLKPRKSADDLFEKYKKLFPNHLRQQLTLGSAKGFTMYKESALAFECQDPKKNAQEISSIGVSAQVLLPDHPEGVDVDRAQLADGAAKLAADTARYVSSTVLKCSSPRLPDGAPDQKPRAES